MKTSKTNYLEKAMNSLELEWKNKGIEVVTSETLENKGLKITFIPKNRKRK